MTDRSVARSIAVAVAIVAFVGVGGGAALAQAPIGPRQHFTGFNTRLAGPGSPSVA